MTLRYLDAREVSFRSVVERAIEAALTGEWEEAAEANRQAIEMAPGDVESHNRLGKALSEIGSVQDAIHAYEAALQLDSNNPIARRNLERLGKIDTGANSHATGSRRNARSRSKGSKNNSAAAEPDAGKSGKPRRSTFLADQANSIVTRLHYPAPVSVLATVSAGDFPTLEVEDRGVVVLSPDGEYLGALEPRLGSRIARLLEGGNRYESVIASTGDTSVSVLIREIYRAPALAKKPSFPRAMSKNDGYDIESPYGNEVRDDEPDASYVLEEDEEDEPVSDTDRTRRLQALISGATGIDEVDSMAV